MQGVGFRWQTQEKARELGVGGWVRNLLDGAVEVRIEGDDTAVEALCAWLETGPRGSAVVECSVRDEDRVTAATGEFEIRPSA